MRAFFLYISAKMPLIRVFKTAIQWLQDLKAAKGVLALAGEKN
jgi:hypothetical protein